MTTTKDNYTGYFAGRALLQQNGSIGGARNVFVKLQGNKNELVFPTFGGQVMNPLKGRGKLFAGDLLEYRTDSNGVKPQIYILKTYEVAENATSSTTIKIVRDGYKHIPFVGDILGVAPESIGGTMTGATVTAVKANTENWELTLSVAITASKGDVLVEADQTGASANMVVKNINAVAPCDYDFLWEPVADTTNINEANAEYEKARYFMTPALGGLMYINKMSPLPDCVKVFNTSAVNGWFKIGAWGNF